MHHLHQVYEGHIVMKADGVMGCALLWKRGRIASLKVESQAFIDDGKPQNQLYLWSHFVHLQTKIPFTVCTTHLKAKRGF